MTTWTPTSEESLWNDINSAYNDLSASEARFLDAIRIPPQKWALDPWGTQGGGFWVIGIIGNIVLWYNDIEEGFNNSRYTNFGVIDKYNCEQDELPWALLKLKRFIETGGPEGRMLPPEAKWP